MNKMKVTLTAWFKYELPKCTFSQTDTEILNDFKSLLDDCAYEYDIVFGGELPTITVDIDYEQIDG